MKKLMKELSNYLIDNYSGAVACEGCYFQPDVDSCALVTGFPPLML